MAKPGLKVETEKNPNPGTGRGRGSEPAQPRPGGREHCPRGRREPGGGARLGRGRAPWSPLLLGGQCWSGVRSSGAPRDKDSESEGVWSGLPDPLAGEWAPRGVRSWQPGLRSGRPGASGARRSGPNLPELAGRIPEPHFSFPMSQTASLSYEIWVSKQTFAKVQGFGGQSGNTVNNWEHCV